MREQRAALRSGHFHAVRFYENDAALCRIVGEFLREGFATDQPGVVIGTVTHRQGIATRLRELSVDVDALEASGDLLFLDAGETLASFMVDGMPNGERFTTAMTQVMEKACRGRTDCTIRAYGEMVDMLWQAGMHAAAIRLEMFWNQLANTHQFSLLCGYSMGSFYKDAAYEDICAQHTHLVSAEGEAGRVN
jgi:hypothetical protein